MMKRLELVTLPELRKQRLNVCDLEREREHECGPISVLRAQQWGDFALSFVHNYGLAVNCDDGTNDRIPGTHVCTAV